MTITESTLIADIASAVPASVRVFQRVGVDFCCGGRRPLGVACAELGLSVADLTRDIEASATTQQDSDTDWTVAPLTDLTRYIVTTYHDALREELPRLVEMAIRVARVHGAKEPLALYLIESALHELVEGLTTHMQKEEQILFPAISACERGHRSTVPLAQAIRVMETEHDGAGELLATLRSVTSGFAVPDWACATTRALYQGLAELEAAMHLHVHLENNVLFPRTLKLTGGEA